MVGNFVTLFFLILGLARVTPPLLRHPDSKFRGLRMSFGVIMVVAEASMVVFLIDGELIVFFVVACLAGGLGYSTGFLLLKQMEAESEMPTRQRKRRNKHLKPLTDVAAVWIVAFGAVVGCLLSIIENRP